MIKLFSKDGCVSCTRAKNLLEGSGETFAEYKLHDDFDEDFVRGKWPSAKSFPIVVVDDVYVGGFDELRLILLERALDTRRPLTEG
jgi:glutaredoxin